MHDVELLLPLLNDSYAKGELAKSGFLKFFCWLNIFSLLALTSNYSVMFCKVCSQNDVIGLLVFSGSVCSFAYLNSKEPISQAVSEIKVFILFLNRKPAPCIPLNLHLQMSILMG